MFEFVDSVVLVVLEDLGLIVWNSFPIGLLVLVWVLNCYFVFDIVC